ncbi:replicative DNA helicase [Paenibacillus koleovorans]|uniref:replicative DNA helicase n=1 Tax=Paenibacillus koleovorans TaxID=121608 RepID=UPI000FD9BEC1|nr:replicative DNA helicase [Paenibacillus koleovorans]
MELDEKQLVTGFRDRMTKLALFDPLFELRGKRKTDRSNKPVDLMEMGLLALLFFFEQKLMRNNKAGIRELAQFLQRLTQQVYTFTEEDMDDTARLIVQTFRPTSGKKREFDYFNWETLQPENASISILKAHAFDLKSNTQYYTLDEDGLELVFATKEFYTEFQLSIHQLVLRKQLEKGEFQGALRQINEMRVDVESLKERMAKLEHEIKRNIVSEETLHRYKTLLDDIYMRLYRENEEFEELRQFVRETRNRTQAEAATNKDQRPYELILRISNELEKVHGEHAELFHRSMELKSQALTAAKESLYYTGLDSFNFEQDIASLIFSSPLPLDSMKGILAPFLQLQMSKQWSLLTVWAEQNVQEEQGELVRDSSFPELGEDQGSRLYVESRKQAYKLFMGLLIDLLEERETAAGLQSLDLAQYVERVRVTEYAHALGWRSFYDFWLILHQRSPIAPVERDAEEDGESQWLDEVFRLLGNRTLVVNERKELIQVNDRFQIQNMSVSWGERADGG